MNKINYKIIKITFILFLLVNVLYSTELIDSLIKKADVFYNKGNYSKAIEFYTKAINKDPKYIDAYFKRGQCYFNTNEHNNTILDFTKAFELDKLVKICNGLQIYFDRCEIRE